MLAWLRLVGTAVAMLRPYQIHQPLHQLMRVTAQSRALMHGGRHIDADAQGVFVTAERLLFAVRVNDVHDAGRKEHSSRRAETSE